MRKRFLSFLLSALLLLSLAACGGEASASRTVFTMDTVMELTVYAPRSDDAAAALDEAEQLLYDLNALLDRHNAHSALSALNRSGSAKDDALAALVSDALAVSEATGGAFDPTVAPLMDAWNFTGDAPRVPQSEDLSALLSRVGAANVSVDGSTITLSGGAQLDLGGIAKGCAGDAVRDLLSARGIKNAVIDLGGDVGLMGQNPDGNDWRVAVKDPADSSRFLGILQTSDCFVVTSGVYERFFEEDGTRYHHILDPKSGRPAESDLVSVSVVCSIGTWADALSTACFVLGEEGSLALREQLAADGLAEIELLFVTDDAHVRYTAGLADRFTPSEEGIYVYEILA